MSAVYHEFVFHAGPAGHGWHCLPCGWIHGTFATETEAIDDAADHASLYCEHRPGTVPGIPGSS